MAPAPAAIEGAQPQIRSKSGLEVRGLTAGWGREAVVFDVDLSVPGGTISCLLGHNGAGKTTTARAIMGVLRVKSGLIRFRGEDLSSHKGPRPGMAYVPSERFSFPDLTVSENLSLGALRNRRGKRDIFDALEESLALFPILKERRTQLAGTMSGGQQRMLSIAMALMSRPRLLLLDEPSLGLSPRLADEVFEKIHQVAQAEDVSMLLLEQNIGRALAVSTRAYVLRSGRIVESVDAEELLERGQESWWDLV